MLTNTGTFQMEHVLTIHRLWSYLKEQTQKDQTEVLTDMKQVSFDSIAKQIHMKVLLKESLGLTQLLFGQISEVLSTLTRLLIRLLTFMVMLLILMLLFQILITPLMTSYLLHKELPDSILIEHHTQPSPQTLVL